MGLDFVLALANHRLSTFVQASMGSVLHCSVFEVLGLSRLSWQL
eukprot:COSAG02_NODE_840_length_16627_cov_11.279828_17_plen_44_part_00